MTNYSTKKIMTNSLNSPEQVLGTIEYSILSSIKSLFVNDMPLEVVNEIKLKINGISATIWSLMILTIEAANDSKDAQLNLIPMKEQLQGQLKEIYELIEKLKTVNFKDEK